MGRSPCCDDENGLKKGPWTPEEDQKLVQYINQHGHGSWRALPKLAGLNRCGKSCRLRWTNYLRPDIKRGKFSQEEEQTILNLHSILGNKWSAIATHLPGRTDNEIKNFWNTHLKKKLIQMGFDPMTHRPRTDLFASVPHLIALANLSELMEHHPLEEHAVRLQAEAVQLARFQYLQYLLQSAAASMTTNPNSQTSIAEMETFNLLNSISSLQENSVLNLSHQGTTPTVGSLGSDANQQVVDSTRLSYFPDLKPPCSTFQTTSLNTGMVQDTGFTMFSVGDKSPYSPWVPPSTSAPPPSQPETEILMSSRGDACNNSIYGGALSFWPDQPLFEDHFMQEME